MKLENYTPLEYFIYVTHEECSNDFHLQSFLMNVSLATGFNQRALFSSSRKKELVAVRRLIACVLIKQSFTWAKIGDIIGGKDHSTALSSVGKAKMERGHYPVQDQYERLFKSLGYDPF
jgi:chromosomal replication initiation ATPase DnaA